MIALPDMRIVDAISIIRFVPLTNHVVTKEILFARLAFINVKPVLVFFSSLKPVFNKIA